MNQRDVEKSADGERKDPGRICKDIEGEEKIDQSDPAERKRDVTLKSLGIEKSDDG